MPPTKRNRLLLAAATVAALILASFVATTYANARGGGGRGVAPGGALLDSALAPSVPGDPPVHAINPGGLPWVLTSGVAQLRGDGRLRVRVEGLVIPVVHGDFPAGTARPVTTVSASLLCAPDSSPPAATTQAVPITPHGNALIVENVALPASCLAPAVVVHPNGGTSAYIAITGFKQ